METITISEGSSGAVAKILPALGFNCYSFQAMHGGKPVELIWAEDGFERGGRRPSGSGIPILFPFPGRIRGTSFDFEGQTYSLEPGDAFGNAIHGFVYTRPWRVVEQTKSRVTGEFAAAVDDPSLAGRWPADFRITAKYELDSNRLSLEIAVENTGEATLPFGLGIHPYFRLPLGDTKAEDCVVIVPVAEYWELKEMIATGRRLPAANRAPLASGIRFAEMNVDDVFTGLAGDAGRWTAEIRDPAAGRTMRFEADDAFHECIIYCPPHREAVCIEPYTCVPDAFRLEASGIDAGLRVLPPGGSFQAGTAISLL